MQKQKEKKEKKTVFKLQRGELCSNQVKERKKKKTREDEENQCRFFF